MFQKILNKITSILTIIFIIFEIIIILFIVLARANGQIPTIFSHNLYVIVSPSMEPELMVGDVIVSKKYDGEELIEGDVITYLGKEGDVAGKLITHKIVRFETVEGVEYIVTQGINGGSEDPKILYSDVKSIMKYKTNVIGPIYRIVNTPIGFVMLIMLPIVSIIVSEIKNLLTQVKEIKEEESKEKEELEKK